MPPARRDLSPSERPELTSSSPRYFVRGTFLEAHEQGKDSSYDCEGNAGEHKQGLPERIKRRKRRLPSILS
jgi:hypothetical protein